MRNLQINETMKQDGKYENLGYPENFDKHPLSNIILKYVKEGPVLDVGCGNGNLLELLKDKFDVEGFDLSEIAVNLSKKRGLNVKVADIQNFKPDKKFKTILMIGILVLSHNPGKDLTQVAEWLDEGGVIILTTPNASSPKNFFEFLKNNQNHIYFPSYFKFRKFLKDNNFKIIKCVCGGRLKLFPILSSVDLYIIKKN